MRNPIISAVLAVSIFWWLIVYGYGLLFGDENTSKAIVTDHFFDVGVASLTVLILVFLATWGYRWVGHGGLLKNSYRGVESTIGIVPNTVHWPKSKHKLAIDEKRWPLAYAWHKKASSPYKEVFECIMRTILSVPNLPASPVKGGHADLTLYEHTLNVVEEGIGELQKWSFNRKPNDVLAGSQIPEDFHHVAILILAGHDIGKLDAFKFNGKVVTGWKKSHDREGARILATIEETWKLPEIERKALIAAVAHEHHPQDLPTHNGDHTRLLMEFLIDVDEAASKKEEKHIPKQTSNESSMEPISSDLGKPAKPVIDADDEYIWVWFMDLMAKPNSINGNIEKFRVGFKGGDGRIFLNEVLIRRRMAEEALGDVGAAEERMGDGRYRITEQLLRILDQRGVLVKSFKDMQFTYKNALFKTESRNPKGKILGQWSAAIIVNLGELTPANILGLKAPNPPEIVGPVFPQRCLKKTANGSFVESSGDEIDKSVELNKAELSDAVIINSQFSAETTENDDKEEQASLFKPEAVETENKILSEAQPSKDVSLTPNGLASTSFAIDDWSDEVEFDHNATEHVAENLLDKVIGLDDEAIHPSKNKSDITDENLYTESVPNDDLESENKVDKQADDRQENTETVTASDDDVTISNKSIQTSFVIENSLSDSDLASMDYGVDDDAWAKVNQPVKFNKKQGNVQNSRSERVNRISKGLEKSVVINGNENSDRSLKPIKNINDNISKTSCNDENVLAKSTRVIDLQCNDKNSLLIKLILKGLTIDEQIDFTQIDSGVISLEQKALIRALQVGGKMKSIPDLTTFVMSMYSPNTDSNCVQVVMDKNNRVNKIILGKKDE